MGVFDRIKKDKKSSGGVFAKIEKGRNEEATARHKDPSQNASALKNEQLSMVKRQPQRIPASSVPNVEADPPGVFSRIRKEVKKAGKSFVEDATRPLKFIDRAAESLAVAVTPDSPMIKDGKNVPGTSARDLQLQHNDNFSTGSKALDKAADVTGELGSYFFNPANPAQGPLALYNSPAVQNLASRISGKVKLPNAGLTLNKGGSRLVDSLASKAVQEGTKEAIVAGAYATPRSLITGQDTLPEIASNVASEAALGAVGGAAAPIVGKALGVFGRLRQEPLNNEALLQAFPRQERQIVDSPRSPYKEYQGFDEPQLALPEPGVAQRMRVAEQRNQLPYGEEEILAPGNVKTYALPEPNILTPTSARKGVRVNPYEQKLNELFAVAKQQNLPPGREREALDDLWSRMAGPNDPGLDELIDLAYPKNVSKLNVNTLRSAREQQQSREVAGAPGPVRSSSDRYQPFVGEAFPPSQRLLVKQGKPVKQAAKKLIVEADFKPVRSEPERATREVAAARQRTEPSQGVTERGFVTTLKDSPKTPETLRERLKAAYTPITNEETVRLANQRVTDIEDAASFVMGKSRLTAEKVTTAHRLIDEFSKQGNYKRAVDIAEKIAEEGTRAGQSIQAFSIYNRLTPEGILVHAQRIAQKANENTSILAKEIKVTDEIAANLTDLATTNQKMTGVKELSNNVMDILDRAKTGEKLSDADATTLKRFVQESQQFVKETTRKPNLKPPQQPKDKRVRDNVVSFLDAQEQAAKERLRARGIQISSTPLDVWADYAIIGASKMGKGAVKFADWSEAMVKDLGENIRPHLQNLYERSRETYEQSTKRVSQQTISQAERLTEKVIKGKQLEGAEADSFRQLAQKVSGLSGESKRLASQDLQMVLQALDKPSKLRQVSSIQTIGQLLNPKTLTRNALGNELFYRVERLNKLIATPIDIARSKITGGDRTVTFRTNNQGEYWKNWMRGLKAGWKGVNVQGLETQYDLGSPAFKGKYNPMTYLEKALGASLKSFDTAAYMRAYNNTLGEMATLKAINAGKRGDKAFIENAIRNADDNVQRIADEYGRYVTFQDNNLISQGLVKLKRGLNLGKDFGMGDLIIKYPRTPGALLMRAIEYSPAGFVRSAVVMARPWYKREPNTAEAVQALSRAIIGTMGLSGMGYFLMDKGILTGAASKDRDIRELQQAAGQGRYQVNLSALKRFITSNFNQDEAKLKEGDFLYSYDWMQPISMAVSIGANTNKNLREGESSLTGLAGTTYNSLEGGLGTLTEQSVLQGLKRAAEGYPGQTVTDKIFDILSDIPSSFVPTASNQIRQLTDNARRETYDPSKLQSSLNRAQNRIPGLAGKLPQQSDTLGRPKEVYQDNNIFNVMFNPGFASRYKLSPEAKLIVGLINETGDESLAPRAPSKSITIDGQSVKLSGEEYARIQQYQGEETRKRLEQVRTNASLKGKINRVEDALRKGGDKARDRLRREMR